MCKRHIVGHTTYNKCVSLLASMSGEDSLVKKCPTAIIKKGRQTPLEATNKKICPLFPKTSFYHLPPFYLVKVSSPLVRP